jgi:hypothetical protein
LRPENLIKRPHITTIKNKEELFCFEKIYLKKYHKCKQNKIQFVYKKKSLIIIRIIIIIIKKEKKRKERT